ncbi:MAG: DUF2505 domain-containing protein [Pedobacter sp.]|nr:DUF2505 domain-containing protein [Pedobacter sp.]
MQEPLQFTYPHTAETVLAMFRDPSYITRKHAQMRQRNIRILDAVDKPERYRLSVRRDAKGLLPESVPEFAQRFLEGRISGIVTTIDWDLSDPSLFIGKNTIELEGLPLKAHIDYWLIPQGAQCLHRQLMHAKVDVPLLGSRLEVFAMDAIRNIQRRDYDYNIEFLRQPPLAQTA